LIQQILKKVQQHLLKKEKQILLVNNYLENEIISTHSYSGNCQFNFG
jgi:hypothetical protein